MPRAIEIFLCYAREDESLRQELEKHLRVLRNQGIVDIWHDRNISAGMEWEREIDNHLNTARIILLLISPDFLVSDYCYSIEMKRAMERHERATARVIPIILRPVYWKKTSFGKLQALPTDGKAILSSHWRFQDEAIFDTAEGIRNIVEDMVAKDTAQEHVDTGNALYEQEKYVEAITMYEKALQYDPECFIAHHNKGSAYGWLLQYEEAIASFDKAIKLRPKEIQIYKNLGNALIYLKRYDEALKTFDKGLAVDNNDKDLLSAKDALEKTIKALSTKQPTSMSVLR